MWWRGIGREPRFDKTAGLPFCTAQPPVERGTWMCRVNPPLSARYAKAPARGLLRMWWRGIGREPGFDKTAGLPFCTAQPPVGRGTWMCRFDKTAGLPFCTAQPPAGRGTGMCRVNPPSPPDTPRPPQGGFCVSGSVARKGRPVGAASRRELLVTACGTRRELARGWRFRRPLRLRQPEYATFSRLG